MALSLLDLPHELLFYIFEFLFLQDLCYISFLNLQCRNIVDNFITKVKTLDYSKFNDVNAAMTILNVSWFKPIFIKMEKLNRFSFLYADTLVKNASMLTNVKSLNIRYPFRRAMDIIRLCKNLTSLSINHEYMRNYDLIELFQTCEEKGIMLKHITIANSYYQINSGLTYLKNIESLSMINCSCNIISLEKFLKNNTMLKSLTFLENVKNYHNIQCTQTFSLYETFVSMKYLTYLHIDSTLLKKMSYHKDMVFPYVNSLTIHFVSHRIPTLNFPSLTHLKITTLLNNSVGYFFNVMFETITAKNIISLCCCSINSNTTLGIGFMTQLKKVEYMCLESNICSESILSAIFTHCKKLKILNIGRCMKGHTCCTSYTIKNIHALIKMYKKKKCSNNITINISVKCHTDLTSLLQKVRKLKINLYVLV